MAELISLTNELLDVILAHLDTPDLVTLMRCSTHLQQRFEPLLYGSKLHHNKAMRWACLNGVNETVRRAAKYGASLSTPELPLTLWSWVWDSGLNRTKKVATSSPVKVLTLGLVAKRGQTDTFKLLLSLGARLDDEDVELKQIMRMLRLICLRRNKGILRVLFESGAYKQIKLISAANWCLTRIIRNGALVDDVRLLLDCGADPNHVATISNQRLCPISAAIMANSEAVVDLLLERGANVNGNGKQYRCSSRLLPWQIPIFAAANSMVRNGTTMLTKCLENGANINYPGHLFRRRETVRVSYVYSTPTPILVYIDSVTVREVGHGHDLYDGIQFFLNHNASLETSDISHNSPYCPWRECSTWPIYRTVLEKFGLGYLTNPTFFSAIKLLSRDCLSYQEFIRLSFQFRESSDEVLQQWQRLITAILKEDRGLEKNELFFQYIIALRGEQWSRDGGLGTNVRSSSLGKFQLAAFDALLDSGIDINCRRCEPDGFSALLFICWYENDAESSQRTKIDPLSSASFTIDRDANKTKDIIKLLLSKGADPMLKSKGQTTFEILMQNEEKFTEEGREYMLSLAEIMREKDSRLDVQV